MSDVEPQPQALSYQGPMMVDRDAEHLKILSICWYVVSGLAALFGCFPVIYVGMGILMIVDSSAFGPGPPPAPLGWMLIIFGSVFMILVWAIAVLGFITAASLPKRRRLAVCYVAAAVACLQIPVGTVLGVFTLIVLSRPSIKAGFG